MVVQIPLAKPINKLHLYRHLLREASYLPRVCRQYARTQIFHRFRRNQDRWTRIDEHIDDGYSALRMMRAANAGELHRMYRIIMLTFGRLGEHRLRRLNTFMKHDGQKNTEDLEEDIQELSSKALGKRGLPVPRKTEVLEKWPIEKMKEYLRGQKAQQERMPKVMWPAPQITRIEPDATILPEKSVWGTPLTENGTRYRLTSWWRAQKARVIPPISETKFAKLRELAGGLDNGKPLRVTPRRPVAASEMARMAEESKGDWDFAADLQGSAAFTERQKSRPFLRGSGLVDDGPWRMSGEQSPLTARNLQRCFRFAFYTASVSRVDASRGERETVWGSFKLRFKKSHVGKKVMEGLSEETGFEEGSKKHNDALKGLAQLRAGKMKRVKVYEKR